MNVLASPDLQAKKLPRQQRSRETVENILSVTVQLLSEVGVERLTTNSICERAGLTPPALYHYFPNKYAILSMLGERLMRTQNALVAQWARPATMRGSQSLFTASLCELFQGLYRLTQHEPGGVLVARALRAMPDLHHVLQESHEEIIQLVGQAFLQAYPQADEDELQMVLRVGVEALSSAQGLLYDQPSLDMDKVARCVCAMVASQFLLLKRSRKPPQARA